MRPTQPVALPCLVYMKPLSYIYAAISDHHVAVIQTLPSMLQCSAVAAVYNLVNFDDLQYSGQQCTNAVYHSEVQCLVQSHTRYPIPRLAPSRDFHDLSQNCSPAQLSSLRHSQRGGLTKL